jgi:hypothetical protein
MEKKLYDYLQENPKGKLDDLPEELKSQFENIFQNIRDIKRDGNEN